MMIGPDKAFPIYSFDFHWIEDDRKCLTQFDRDEIRASEPDNWKVRNFEGLPLGRTRNAIGQDYYMAKERLENPQRTANLRWIKLAESYRADAMTPPKSRWDTKNLNPVIEEIGVKFLGWETWCVTWFSHQTFEQGLDDAEVLDSFYRYVQRHQWYQDYKWDSPHRPDFNICLMGAEDHFRWCGSKHGSNKEEDRTDPPCRCEHCKRQGLIRIGH